MIRDSNLKKLSTLLSSVAKVIMLMFGLTLMVVITTTFGEDWTTQYENEKNKVVTDLF